MPFGEPNHEGRHHPATPLEFNYGYTTADHVGIYVAQDLGLFELMEFITSRTK